VTPSNPDLATAEPGTDGFGSLGLDGRLLETLGELGYEEPTPIQLAAIPPLLEGRDLLAEAPTGTGKTAAFALPALQRLVAARSAPSARPDGHPAALVLVPTRELAIQVSEAVHRYGERLGVRVLPVYGGQAIGAQLRSLRRGVDLIVATPGRAIDHLKRGTLTLDRIEIVILDEADEMLDMGFAEDLEALLSGMPAGRQTALFSATISGPIARIAQRHLRSPARVTIHADRRTRAGVAGVRQLAYVVRRSDKLTALGRILDIEDPASALVFARTRGEVDELAERLSGRGRDAAALHGGLSQEQRDRIMGRFRSGELDVLVATDVAARGLDIERVSHVVNYDIPSNPDVYVHRIGRTGRAGRAGVAITLVEPREYRLLANIERHVSVRLDVTPVPTAADLQERRLDALREQIRTALGDEGRERVRAVIEPLLAEHDPVDVAIAAAAVAEQAMAGDAIDEADVERVELGDRPKRVTRPAPVPPRRGHTPLVHRDRRPGAPSPGGAPPGPGPGSQWTRLFVGAGRKAGLRPGDLVGAITGETRVTGKSVGAIQIADSYSLVEVPDHAADEIVRALSAATIKGRRLPVRRERPREG
jgi:ATP-dependent RNA helicase DeaD